MDTHARYFHPLFRFKAVEPNTSPPTLPPTAVDEIWLAEWPVASAVVRSRDHPSSRSNDRTFMSYVVCAIRDGENPNYRAIFFFSSPPPFRPPFPSPSSYRAPQISLDLSESWNRIGERRFLVNFYHLCPRSGNGRGTFFAISYLQCPYIVWSEAQTPPVCLIFR